MKEKKPNMRKKDEKDKVNKGSTLIHRKQSIVDIESIEKQLNTSLPVELRKFYQGGLYQKYEGWYFKGLPHYGSNEIRVRFFTDEFKLEKCGELLLMPFAYLIDFGVLQKNILLIDLSSVEVLFREDATGIISRICSLDEFVDALFPILYKLWTNRPEKGYANLSRVSNYNKNYRIRKGISLRDEFPDDAYVQMRTNYKGYQKDTKLRDIFDAFGECPIINDKVKFFLEKNKIGNVEYLPIALKNHEGETIQEPYYVLNVLALDCLDLERSEPDYNSIIPTSIDFLEDVVFHEDKIPDDILLFRAKNYGKSIFIKTQLADLLENEGFSGVSFHERLLDD